MDLQTALIISDKTLGGTFSYIMARFCYLFGYNFVSKFELNISNSLAVIAYKKLQNELFDDTFANQKLNVFRNFIQDIIDFGKPYTENISVDFNNIQIIRWDISVLGISFQFIDSINGDVCSIFLGKNALDAYSCVDPLATLTDIAINQAV